MRTSRGRTMVAAAAVAAIGGSLLVVSMQGSSATAAGGCAPDPPPNELPTDFAGDRLLVLNDADMAASAFMDGKLKPGDRQPRGARDALTVLGLPLQVGVPRQPHPDAKGIVSGQTPVENSVIGPPYGMDVSPDGTRAYVLRTRGSAPDGVTEVDNVFTDLPGEAVVSTVDISDPRRPEVVQQTVVGSHAHTLSLSPDGRFLAVNTDEADRNIVIRAVMPNGNVGAEVAAISADPNGEPVRRVGRVEWHPSGRFLAHGVPFRDEIVFYEFERSRAGVDLRPWGAPVKVGKFPDEGTFTANGDYYLTTDLQWGDDVPGLFHDPPPGTVTAVRFDAERGRHRVTGRAGTDVSPEGIAVSPDGRFVVTGNLTSSWMPWTDSRFEPGGSLNLLELDPRSGKLRTRQQLAVNGILPEGITFDASGNHVAATMFDHYDPRYRRGGVQFLTLSRDDCPNLIPTHTELEVPAGPHSVHLIR
jgi:hypothetical protein